MYNIFCSLCFEINVEGGGHTTNNELVMALAQVKCCPHLYDLLASECAVCTSYSVVQLY